MEMNQIVRVEGTLDMQDSEILCAAADLLVKIRDKVDEIDDNCGCHHCFNDVDADRCYQFMYSASDFSEAIELLRYVQTTEQFAIE